MRSLKPDPFKGQYIPFQLRFHSQNFLHQPEIGPDMVGHPVQPASGAAIHALGLKGNHDRTQVFLLEYPLGG